MYCLYFSITRETSRACSIIFNAYLDGEEVIEKILTAAKSL